MIMPTLTTEQDASVQAKQIVYDPVAWIHPRRFSLPSGFSSPACRRVLNDMLLTYFDLTVGPLNFDNGRERYLARYWHLLSTAAFMVACQRYKPSLFRQGLWWTLDEATRQFALLDLHPCRDDLDSKAPVAQLWASAASEIGAFAESVSDVMKTRLPLLFPKPEDDLIVVSSASGSNEFIMRMAIQHAERNQ